MKKLFIIIVFFSFFAILSSYVSAQGGVNANNTGGVVNDGGVSNSGSDGAKTVKLDNPLGAGTTVPSLIGRVITGVLGIVGSLALVMVIYGGFTWMLAAGNSEKVKKGRDIIVWAAIGLVVIFTSYALVKFVIEAIE